MLEFVDYGLYFVQDENNFIHPVLKVGSGSGSDEKSLGSGRPKINGSSSRVFVNPSSIVGGRRSNTMSGPCES